ncbi:hypothetical protein DYU11_24210 [Fibrisoma montanum]|uniref:Uncharacterized protein n=1 Tax=Fibrisoma montanum TaxID=2305895 RepID=A0A418M301_9BACT|nr:hypothetical protein [Fibrisoma montanum]RIV20017.1 hypothetical protein DYU11_24210 [Fibrisoma montanum]
MKRFYWVGYCEEDRLRATPQIARIINQHGALVNSNFFSDLATSFVIEVPADQIQALHTDLQQLIQLEDAQPLPSNGSYECTVLLNLSFARGSGNLKVEVPAVPG